MNDLLQVPAFARLADYVGLWAMRQDDFQFCRELVAAMDLKAHVDDGSEPIRAATEMQTGPGGKSIAVIKATGILMKSQTSLGGTSTIQLRREIRAAAADPNVAGILLAVDSPGGTVAGTDDLAKEIRTAAKVKPLWAHAEDLMASAAFWAASQASRITANSPTALVGSIGTLQVVYDHSGAAEKAGVRTLIFGTGPLKGMGTMGSKITDDQAAHLQGLVNSVQESFDAAVQRGRNLTNKELASVRHGGVMTSMQALDARLIDAVQPLSKTLSDFSQAIKSGGMAAQADADTNAGRPGFLAGSLPMLRRGLPMLTK